MTDLLSVLTDEDLVFIAILVITSLSAFSIAYLRSYFLNKRRVASAELVAVPGRGEGQFDRPRTKLFKPLERLFKRCNHFERSPSLNQRRITAFHEAGHLMLYRALGAVPRDARAVVLRSDDDPSPVLGYVSSFKGGVSTMTKSFAEWAMMMLLAGQESERIRFGEPAFGASSDLEKWQSLAGQYLREMNNGIFFITPASASDHAHNTSMMQRLLEEHRSIVNTFLASNRPALERIANSLLAKGTLEEEEIAKLLVDVTMTEGIPQPFGIAEVFDVVNRIEN